MKEVSLEEPLSLKTALFIQNSLDTDKRFKR